MFKRSRERIAAEEAYFKEAANPKSEDKSQDTRYKQIPKHKHQIPNDAANRREWQQVAGNGKRDMPYSGCTLHESLAGTLRILAQLSRRETVRLKTRLPSEESSGVHAKITDTFKLVTASG